MRRIPVLLPLFLLLSQPAGSARQIAGAGGSSQIGAESLGEKIVSGLDFAGSEGDRRVLSRRPLVLTLEERPPARLEALPALKSRHPLYGYLRLARAGRIAFVLDQSEPGSEVYDLLVVDLNANRDLSDDGEAFHGSNRYSDERRRNYTEFPIVRFPGLYYAANVRERFDVFFYLWYPKDGPPDRLYACSASWREGDVKVKDRRVRICVFDEDVDGEYGLTGSSWSLVTEGDPQGLRYEPASRLPLSVPIRIGSVPWRISSISPEGRVIELVTETEEKTRTAELEANPFLLEVPRKRTDHDPLWVTDLELARTAAREEGKRVLLVFSADWLESWRDLAERTFRDVDVQEALNGYIPVLVPFEGREDLARRFGVDVPATCIVLDADLKEIDRRVGYLPARAFETWLEALR